MSRLMRIGVALSYLSLAAAPLYGASGETKQVQDVPAASTPTARDASRVESFRSQLQEQQKTLQSFGEKISALVDRLKAMSGATVESRMTEVRSLREALVQLGTQLQPDAPLSQSIDQYQSWISAQMGRINSQRGTLGPGIRAGARRPIPGIPERSDAGARGGGQSLKCNRPGAQGADDGRNAGGRDVDGRRRCSRHQGASDCDRRDRPNDRGHSQQPPEARERRCLIPSCGEGGLHARRIDACYRDCNGSY